MRHKHEIFSSLWSTHTSSQDRLEGSAKTVQNIPLIRIDNDATSKQQKERYRLLSLDDLFPFHLPPLNHTENILIHTA